MGPSMIVDGDGALQPGLDEHVDASMGPSMIVDGDGMAAAWPCAQGIASMGPSMIVDGDVRSRSLGAVAPALQWGRR